MKQSRVPASELQAASREVSAILTGKMLEPVRQAAWGAVVTLLVTACGGRTEMLDDHAADYGSNQPSGGAGPTAPHNQGGAGAAGANSTTPTGPTAGSAGSTVDPPGPPSLVETCSKYCAGITNAPCGVGGDMNACVASCSGGLSRLSATCQSIALDAFECLSAIAAVPAGECAAATRRLEATCASALNGLGPCLRGMSGMPVPTPPAAPEACGRSSSGKDHVSCTAKLECNSGRSYSVQCSEVDPDQSNCICVRETGEQTPFELDEGVTWSCADALIACSTESIPPPK